MIIRIVRMTFREEKVADFLKMFDETKHLIRHYPGCTNLELMKDAAANNIFITFSHWKSEQDLENYRNSELFGKVWKETKSYFADKPTAFSMKKFIVVE